MSSPPDPDLKRWVDNWRTLGPELERIRRRELKQVDTVKAVQSLAGAFQYARKHYPPKGTSGLVEQQRWFQRLRS